MENNYYMDIDYEFDTTVKGLRGKFKGNQTYHHKYGIDKEKLDCLTSDIKKYLKEDKAMIDLCINNSDWYGAPRTIFRILKEWNGELFIVDFREDRPKKKTITSRQISEIVKLFRTILDEEVNNTSYNVLKEG